MSGYTESKKNKKEKTKRSFYDISDEEQLDRLKRMARTRQKAKWDLMWLVDTNFDNRTSFLTLTTKDNIESREKFNDMFDKFITRFNYHFLNTKKRELKYLAVLEKQKRGAYHAHILLFNIRYIPHKKINKVLGYGFVWVNKINELDDSSNAGRYVAKYMEKAIGQKLLESKGKKAFYFSRNLRKPTVTKILSFEKLESLLKYSKVLYQNEYIGKFYKNNQHVKNVVKYKKIKIDEEY